MRFLIASELPSRIRYYPGLLHIFRLVWYSPFLYTGGRLQPISHSMKSTVLIDAERLRSPANGLGQVSLNLSRELMQLRSDYWRPVFLVPKHRQDILGETAEIEVAGWKRRHLPQFGRRFGLWHVTHQDSVFCPNPGTRYVLTIHDLNFLKEKSPEKAAKRLAKVQALVDGATWITTISEFTRGVVEEHLHLGDTPVTVIYNAPCTDPDLTAARPPNVPDDEFLLALGVVRPKKNLHVLMGFLARVEDVKLVIAGNNESDYLDRLLSEAQEHGVLDRVVVTGEVSEAEKLWLLQNCKALTFPSLLEGFGLPVIEAMSYGKPVFCSHLTSLPEIGGDAAYYWHDFNPDSMATVYKDGMAALEADPDGANKLRARAAEFNWADAAKRYGDLYETILAEQD